MAAEPFEDAGYVWGLYRLGDVVGVGDLLAGVPELRCRALGIDLLLDEGGDGLSEGVRGDPVEVGFGAGLAPLTADVVGGEPGASSGREDRVVGVRAMTRNIVATSAMMPMIQPVMLEMT